MKAELYLQTWSKIHTGAGIKRVPKRIETVAKENFSCSGGITEAGALSSQNGNPVKQHLKGPKFWCKKYKLLISTPCGLMFCYARELRERRGSALSKYSSFSFNQVRCDL